MNMALLLVFPAIMAWAAASDLLTMRIANHLVLALLAAFAVMVPATGMPLEELYSHALAGGIVLVVAFSFFAFGWIGGGDAKLAAVTALWLGWTLLLPYAVYSALLGGALTLFILAVRRWPLPAALVGVGWVDRLHNANTGVPYGIALAAAGMLVYADSFVFAAFALG
ncbi:MAG: prepilin peptidase [Alphaproteobacteria bacterium]|nr:prepilin peptidase [Alphaproteobacteria bacterium]